MKQSKKRKIVNIAIFAAILMGRGFSWEDIVAYAAGSILNVIAAFCLRAFHTD